MKKNDRNLWPVKPWGIPPKANADVVSHREDVLRVSQWPADRPSPVVCLDEASQPLLGEVNAPWPRRSGCVKGEDDAEERKGGGKQFLGCEPLRGWRPGRVTARRTTRDWAAGIRELVDVPSPQATRRRVVLDHLNTHTGAALYEAFPPDDARR